MQINQINMKLRIILFLIICLVAGSSADGQKPGKKIKITGFVKDQNNNPIPDVIILIDNVKTNIVTNQNGSYRIKVKPAAKKIGIFSFMAGVAEEAIDGRTTINFKMTSSGIGPAKNQVADPGDEMINVGYGNVNRKDLTQPVSKIDGTNKKYASYNSIYDMIKGEVAGVQVNGKSIKIQGASSFILSTEPLFVVDGMTVSSIDDIRPYMVKSIEVLKGSAASVYGSRGANGVILINTLTGPDYK